MLWVRFFLRAENPVNLKRGGGVICQNSGSLGRTFGE